MLGWTNSKPWIQAWLGDELVSLPALIHLCHQDQLPHFVQVKDKASFPTLHRQGKGPVLLCPHPWGWLNSDHATRVISTVLSHVMQGA